MWNGGQRQKGSEEGGAGAGAAVAVIGGVVVVAVVAMAWRWWWLWLWAWRVVEMLAEKEPSFVVCGRASASEVTCKT